MSLEVGTLVEQMHRSKCRRGVIYKNKKVSQPSAIVEWSYFEVLWATGERSVERADHLCKADTIPEQFNDLVVLKDLQNSIAAGASYD